VGHSTTIVESASDETARMISPFT